MVAPYVGAWIETIFRSSCFIGLTSHPTWVRGLKHIYSFAYEYGKRVAPYVGAWIETLT